MSSITDDVMTPCLFFIHRSAPTGQDERAQFEQCGRGVLHPDRGAGARHAGGPGGVLLQVTHRVQENEGGFNCHEESAGKSLLQVCTAPVLKWGVGVLDAGEG